MVYDMLPQVRGWWDASLCVKWVQEFFVRFHDMLGLAADVVWWCWQEKWEAGGPRKHAAS